MVTMNPDRAARHFVHPFQGSDVWQLLRLRAERTGKRPFMQWSPYLGEAATWTFESLYRDAGAVGAGLVRRGVKPGDKVLIHLENCPEFIISWFGCAAVGAVAVTTNTRSAGDELAYYIADSGVVGAITQPRFAEVVATSGPSLLWRVVTDNDSGVPNDSGERGDEEFSSLLR